MSPTPTADQPGVPRSSARNERDVPHDGERLLDRAVGPRSCARPSGSLTGPHEVISKGTNCWSQLSRSGVDSTLPTSLGEPGFLV